MKLVGEMQIVTVSLVLERKRKVALAMVMENVARIKIWQTTVIVHVIKVGKV